MRKFLIFLAMMPFVCFGQAEYNIIPQPESITYSSEVYTMSNSWSYTKAKKATDPSIPEEGYKLDITPKKVTITASTKKGFYYGQQTLRQIVRQSKDNKLQCLSISDKPRFEYRGLMLDVVRCYIPKDEILKIIDIASQVKINNLHLHLTDDNGWRMQIKKYPQLTKVGAWRVERDTPFPNRENPKEGEPTPVGGFYTQKELKEIVAYASKRGMTVIPEIEMPAHSVAAIASYPEMTCPTMGDRFIGVLPGIGGKDASIIYCAGNEKVYGFLQDILDEVLEVFPSKYIHIGGDEAEKSHWKACPRCQELMKREGIQDEENLQGYFMDRMISYLKSKGRKAIGWDEVTMGHPKEDITIFGWRGMGQAAIKDARENGREFVLTPGQKLYLIRYQGPQWFEPYTYFGNNTLKDCYTYEPVAEDWSPQLENQLKGIQGSLWTEFCKDEHDVEYLLFPRVMAIADNAWRTKGISNWEGFFKGLNSILSVLWKRGAIYAPSFNNIQHKVMPKDGNLAVSLTCERPDVEIRYTTDGNEPTVDSELYNPEKGLIISKDSKIEKIEAATFKDKKKKGQLLTLTLVDSKAKGCDVKAVGCTNGYGYVLTNGIRGSERHSDFEWAGWYDKDAEFVVDLGQETEISGITLGSLSNCNMTVAAPRKVSIYGSTDGENYTIMEHGTLPDDQVFSKLPKKININLDFPVQKVRFVKVVAEKPGLIPTDYLRGGQTPWMYFDEFRVR